MAFQRMINMRAQEETLMEMGLRPFLAQPRVWYTRPGSRLRNGFYLDGSRWAVTAFSNYGMLETGLWFQDADDQWQMVHCPTFGYVYDAVQLFENFQKVAEHLNYISDLMLNIEKREQAIQEATSYLAQR